MSGRPAPRSPIQRLTGRLVHVEARHFTAGLILHNGICIDAAPILRWAIGRRWSALKPYLDKRNFVVTLVG